MRIGMGEAGNVARRGLSLLSSAMEASTLTSKFVQCLSTLEFLAFPDEMKRMPQVKAKIGLHVANNIAEYHAISEEFRRFTSHVDNGQQTGIRTNLVHMGKRFETVVPDRHERTKIFRKLQMYIGKTISDLIRMGDQDWSSVEAFREGRQKILGLGLAAL